MTERTFMEQPKNPGLDDSRCALCEAEGLDEGHRCHGCGYLIYDDHPNDPWGTHLVVEHDNGDDDEEDLSW